jgi:hypothetical protein
MKNDTHTPSNTSAESTGTSNQGDQLTPELVRQVADKVYTMLVKELDIEKERHRLGTSGRFISPGGCAWTQ